MGKKDELESIHPQVVENIPVKNLYSKRAVMAVLDRYCVAPLKKLGQNFLVDEHIVQRIADAAVDGENVLEIGPGMGALTTQLAKRAKRVVAVEIDSGMVKVLVDVLSGTPNVHVINRDILKTDLNEIGNQYFNGEPFAVVGNLPYYITAKCMIHVLDSGAQITSFTAMVQKEVADRLAASAGKSDYGALTASVRYYGEMKKLFGVDAECFYPKPDVASAVVYIRPQPVFDVDRKNYVKTVRALFAMRRKTLENNFKAAFSFSTKTAEEKLAQAGIPLRVRAETLQPADFARLARVLFEEK